MTKSSILIFIGGFASGVLCLSVFKQTPQQNQQAPQKPEAAVAQSVPTATPLECPKDPTIQDLAAPTFHASMPDILNSGNDGVFKIRWNPVEYAKSYVIRLYTPTGKQLSKWKTSFPTVTLKDLPFDEGKEFTPYVITVASVNRLDVIGPESGKKEIHVKRRRNIVAPGIDSITVED
jgi:hypothetical protein